VLGTAFAIGLYAALAPHAEVVLAAGPGATLIIAQGRPTPDAPAAADPSGGKAPKPAEAKPAPAAPPAATPPPAPAASKAPARTPPAADSSDDEDGDEAGKDAASGNHGIIIHKGSKRIRIEGIGRDGEYDSFEQFINDAPWLAGVVFLTVLLVFLVPLLIIVLLIWYKMRKNRLANETMIKLAERGVLPPAAAMEAVASGSQAAAAATATAPPPAGMPAYEYARSLQRRTVWSDLRKGVILTGVGLGLTVFSMLDDGTPNSVGLVFLFVGLGYGLLWFFEERNTQSRRDSSGNPPPGAA